MDSHEKIGDEQTTVTWTTQLRGFRGLPLRHLFNVADFSRSLWWSALTVVPLVLLVVAVVVGDETNYFYSMYAAVMILFLSQMSERFIHTTIEFGRETGELETTYHLGNPSLFRGGEQTTILLEDVEAARFLSFAGHTMVRLHHPRAFSTKPTAFLIPPDKDWEFRRVLKRHDVSIDGAPEGDSTDWVWGRCAVTGVFLGILPVCAAFIWHPAYSWSVLLVLFVNAIFLLRQGW
ncbi:hypothetical protein C440_06087 [Haloferax mucosum ATCC BAA-1512]|uniref:Uncharacterized protein n=1 Tax=Haloferax mucosum ATCC BAA-1512 TaxID=662479 RepID=M0IGD5_9EURY|nr:hypothetical protein [Haloferax mucosum]ELZ95836.1 hypothetical protein C440_06087 [Haloferax mucosum ATCC BAA-1512]